MLSVVQYKLKFPIKDKETGMAICTSGKFVVVSSVSALSEFYGIIKNDRIIDVNGISCINQHQNAVAELIRKYQQLNQLEIHFERSFPVEDTPKIDQEIKAPLDNDAIFQEGIVRVHKGHDQLGDIYVRIFRMKGRLLLTANKLNLVPYSISILLYKTYQSPEPFAGFNLLPCNVRINSATDDPPKYSFTIYCLAESYTFTFHTTAEFNQWLLVICDLIQQDIQPLLTEFKHMLHKDTEDSALSLQKENEELFKVMKNNLNIPVYEHIAYLYKELIEVVLNQIPQPAMKDRILKLVSIKNELLDNGYAPAHIYHSVMALLLTVYNKLKKKEEWNEDVQSAIKELATFFHDQQETYNRNRLIHHSGFLVFGCYDEAIVGTYKTQQIMNQTVIYQNKAQTRLFAESSVSGKMKWVFVKKDAATPSFFAYGDAIVPPRFQWQSDTQNDFPPIVQATM